MILRTFAAVAERRPDAVALVDQRDRTLTFGELATAVEHSTVSLRALGLGPGSVLGIFEPNRVEWMIAALAGAAIGAQAIGLNTRFRTAELDYLLHIGRVDAVLAPDHFLGVRPGALLSSIADSPTLLVDGDPDAFDDRFSPVAWAEVEAGSIDGSPGSPILTTPIPTTPIRTTPIPTADALGAMPWCGFTTSGTTGHPKLAVHSQAGTLHHMESVIAAFGLDDDTVSLVPLPLCGVFGFTTALATLLAGGTTILHETFDAGAAARAITEHGVTFTNGADNMLEAIFDQPDFDGATSSWTTGVYADFTNTGAQVAERAEIITNGRLRLSGVYGSSEGFALMSRWPPHEPLEQRARNGGRLVSDQLEVRCADPGTTDVKPHGEPGELQFRGPGMIDGYVSHPDAPDTSTATEAAFTDDGWFCTGDLGYTTEDRAFVYNARLGDSLRLRGFLCDPTEIERHLEQHPSVDLSQVVGVDRPGGEVAVAFVRLLPDAMTGTRSDVIDELRASCRAGLANYKMPDQIVIVDDFPVTDGPNGVKIRKVDLRTRAAELYTDPDPKTPTRNP